MYFRRAASIAAGSAAIHAAWGDLFLEKYNYSDAVQAFNEAVEIDDQWVPAHLGLARALADENPPAGAQQPSGRWRSTRPTFLLTSFSRNSRWMRASEKQATLRSSGH